MHLQIKDSGIIMQPKTWVPLTLDYKPPTLLHRDEQFKEMFNLITHPIPHNVWAQGDAGRGKSLTARFLKDEIEARGIGKCFLFEWESSYVKALQRMNERYNLQIPKYALSPSQIATKIIKLTKEDDLVCIIVDEPQKAHFMKDVDNTVFSLFQTFQGQRRCSFVVLSQIRYALVRKYFAPDTLSRLQLKPILFGHYDVPEIADILEQRLHYALESGQYDYKTLIMLGKHVRRTGSDIREAIEILAYAIENSEEKLTTEVMNVAIEWGKCKWWKKEMLDLPPHYAYIMYIAAQEVTRRNSSVTYLPYIKGLYLQASKKFGFNPLGLRTIYEVFYRLSGRGFFHTEMEGHGRKAQTKIIFDKGDLEHIVKVGKDIEWDTALVSL